MSDNDDSDASMDGTYNSDSESECDSFSSSSMDSDDIVDGLVGEDDDILEPEPRYYLQNGYGASPDLPNNFGVEVVEDENESDGGIAPLNLFRDYEESLSGSSGSNTSMITVSSGPGSSNNLMSSGENTSRTNNSTDMSSLTESPRFEPPEQLQQQHHDTPRNDDELFQRPQAPTGSASTTASEPDLDVLSLTCSSLSSMSSFVPSEGSNESPRDFKK